MNGVLALLPSIPARASLRMVLSLQLLRGLIAPLIEVQRFQHIGMLWGEKNSSDHPLIHFAVLKVYFLSLQCQGAGCTMKLFGFCLDKASANCPRSSREQNQTETYHSE